ncbi:MAG: FtsX-like permease family protein [Paludibacteraceae bacterium]|nr:FtsX-like permease family protein [Paludibacteraceae bacterium]MBR2451511.1 FtsX-like permease family protein [Paludibacteraceae bacterium]
MKFSKLLNILGMTAAFAALYIILVQVHYDLTYNRAIPDSERVYLMTLPSFGAGETKQQSFLARPFAEYFLEENIYVEAYGVAQLDDVNKVNVIVGEGTAAKTHSVTFAQMTSGALKTFGIQPVMGSLEDIGEGGYVAISETAAERLGVAVDSVLQLESWGQTNYFVVRAIYKDLPVASDLKNIEVIRCNQLEEQDLNSTSNWSYQYFVKLRSTEDKALCEEVISKKYAEIMAQELKRYRGMQHSDPSFYKQLDKLETFIDDIHCTLMPIRDLYYDDTLEWSVGQEQGNKTSTITLMIVAALIVIITLINYVNFFFAQVPMRIRGVNTRKILGSSRAALVGRFLAESAVLVAIALVLAVVVVLLFCSTEWVHYISCDLALSKNMVVAVLTVGIALVMTLMAGLYPAMYATSFPPALAIKGSFGMSQKGKSLRYALIGLQFVISIAFIICAIFLKKQHSYMMNYDMGFNKECLITANIPLNSLDERDAFSSELLNNPNIKEVAWSQDRMVADMRMTWGRWRNGEQMMINVMPVSWNYLQVMGIEVFEGRDFLPSDEKGNGAIILNEYAKKKYNLNLEEVIEWNGTPFPATGFCRDFHFKPLHEESDAFAFYIYDTEIQNRYYTTPHLTLRTIENADIKAVFDAIRATTDKILPDYGSEKVKINFFNEELGENYQKEQQLTTTISLFTMLAIIISLMGVLGLVIFETQYRRKEIGIRRVNGATVREILVMFNRKFMIIVGICFLIAAPISYFITDYYYSTFAYRAPIAVWVFVVALLAVLVITTLVVTLASLRTATSNPVEALRTE